MFVNKYQFRIQRILLAMLNDKNIIEQIKRFPIEYNLVLHITYII
jgi:hypothetical protein